MKWILVSVCVLPSKNASIYMQVTNFTKIIDFLTEEVPRRYSHPKSLDYVSEQSMICLHYLHTYVYIVDMAICTFVHIVCIVFIY